MPPIVDSKGDHEQPCHLLKLPLELRLEIYDYLYTGPFVWKAVVRDSVFVGRTTDEKSLPRDETALRPDRGSLALLRTCKSIRDEVSPIFYDNLTLTIHVVQYHDEDANLSPQLIRLSPVARLSVLLRVKGMKIHMCDCPFCSNKVMGAGSNLSTARLARLIKEADYGRNLKHLTINIHLRHQDYGPSKLLEAIKSIDCKGEVIIRASSYAKIFVGRDKLVEAARAIGG